MFSSTKNIFMVEKADYIYFKEPSSLSMSFKHTKKIYKHFTNMEEKIEVFLVFTLFFQRGRNWNILTCDTVE